MGSQNETLSGIEQVLRLPLTAEHTIPANYMDMNGHMNVMYYTEVGNMAIERFLEIMGLSLTHFQAEERGLFALRQILSYLSELREGDKVAVHSGLVGHDAKRIHFVHYIVNLTHNRLASTDERVAMYMDMTKRRSTPFEPDKIEKLDEALKVYAGLGWTPELSGAIKLKQG